MRIAVLSYHTCPLATLGGKDTGGMNVYVRDLTRYLGPLGVKVDIYTRSQDEHVPHVLHDLGYGNRVVHIPAGPEVPLPKEELVKHLPDFVEGVLGFSEKKDIKYDLIHSHYWISGLAARDLKQVWNIPIIHMFHTLFLLKERVARTPQEVEGEFRLNGERAVIESADWIVASTKAGLAQLQWLYEVDVAKVVVIPPGVDLSHFYPIAPDEAKEYVGVPSCDSNLLFVGRVEPLKGIDTLIEAIALLQKDLDREKYSVCLSVIGGNPDHSSHSENHEMERLKAMRKEYGLDNMVALLGQRSQDSLPYYYSAAEAVVVPSHYESFGMVALEAMACGTPVVASQVGGLAFLVQDGVTGFTIPADEPEALAERLEDLIVDNELRERLGKQAAEFAVDYDWKKIARRVLKLYERVIGGKKTNTK